MKEIAIVGAGTMGNGIAHHVALFGYKTWLIDISKAQLEIASQTIGRNMDRQIKKDLISPSQKESALSRLQLTDDFSAASESDLVIEAVTENYLTKSSLLKTLSSLVSKKTLLASNTSSISITQLASNVEEPSRFIGMHFMNPVPVMKLVEVINGYSTSSETTSSIVKLAENINKIPVIVNDYPGFIANRILMPMINEAIYSLYEGVAGVREIDTIMKLGMSHPMGPLQLADYIGLDVCLSIMTVMHDGLGNPKYAPCPLLKNMVYAGKLGVKSGEGFYAYNSGSNELKVSHTFLK